MVYSMAESAQKLHWEHLCDYNYTQQVLKSDGITATVNVVIQYTRPHTCRAAARVSHAQHAMVPIDLPISNSFGLEKGSWVVDGPLVNGVSTRKTEKVYIYG